MALSSWSSALTRCVITAIDGVEFEEAWPERLEARFADQSVGVLSRRHLIQNKRAAGRDQDLVDLMRLELGERDR